MDSIVVRELYEQDDYAPRPSDGNKNPIEVGNVSQPRKKGEKERKKEKKNGRPQTRTSEATNNKQPIIGIDLVGAIFVSLMKT